jgi:hypothetical protein
VPDVDDQSPIPFGVRDDGWVLDDLKTDAILASPAWPLSKSIMQERAGVNEGDFGVDESRYDPNDLRAVGWAVLFAPGVDPKIKEALQPLLDHRKNLVGEGPFRIFDGDYQPRETAKQWLARQKVSMRTVVPKAGVPYYLLIVASPADISFEFQYSLDIFWAVGRIWFETAEENPHPEPDKFRQYAWSVVCYEKAKTVPTSRQLAFFTAQNQGDKATRLLMKEVALPLVNGTEIEGPIGQDPKQKFKVHSILGNTANKDALNAILRGQSPDGPPALLFTGSHGKAVSDPSNVADLAELRGALICGDWVRGVPATPDQVYAGRDLPADAKVHGMIHFMFACYGAGWPQYDNYGAMKDGLAQNYVRVGGNAPQISPRPMVSRLPQNLLSHVAGGALAVIGHIDRAWAWSFESEADIAQPGDFSMILNQLMAGNRIGQATDKFNFNWAALSTDIGDNLSQMQINGKVLPEAEMKKLANQWIARDDARNYVVFGDPAVRLRTEDMPVLT